MHFLVYDMLYFSIFLIQRSNLKSYKKTSVVVESNFNSIELTRPILTLELGKFPSLIEWDKWRMRVKCLIRLTRSRDVTWRANHMWLAWIMH